MPRFRQIRFAALVLLLAAIPSVTLPQSAPPAPQGYRPGLGDLMTMTVQPRHIKLGLAGESANWAYAAYELHELEEAFERVGKVWPQWRKFAIVEMLEAMTKEPIAAMREAIKAADLGRYQAAYRQLTEACNACHTSAGRGMIVMKAPDASAYPDQDFRLQSP